MSNWSKYDYFLPMGFQLEKNALLDIRGGVKAQNNDGVKVQQGFQFNGSSQWIDSAFNLANDGINYQLEDADAQAFVFQNDNPTGTSGMLFGCEHSSILNLRLSYSQNFSFRMNSRFHSTGTVTDNVGTNVFLDKTLHGTSRDASLVYFDQDGIQINSSGKVADNVPNRSPGIAALNAGTAGSHLASIISMFSLGSMSGVNTIARNDNIRQFLTDLQIDLSIVANKLAGETLTDTLQGDTISDELKGD